MTLPQHEQPGREQRMGQVRQLIEGLMDFDQLDSTQVKEQLEQLAKLVEPLGDSACFLALALKRTGLALDIPFSDPVMETWASWPARAAWIAAELEHAAGSAAQIATPAPVTPELEQYREKFRADTDGWPSQMDLNVIGDREEMIKDIAFRRMAAFQLCTIAAKEGQELSALDVGSRSVRELLTGLKTVPEALGEIVSVFQNPAPDSQRDQLQHFYSNRNNI